MKNAVSYKRIVTVSEKQLVFKCLQKPQISSCQNETLYNDNSVLGCCRKAIFRWARVPDF